MSSRAQPDEDIAVVLDVGPKTRLGLSAEHTFFAQSKSCLINIVQRKIFAENCRVAVVLFGTDGTCNRFAASGQFQNIIVYQHLQLVDWGCLQKAKELPQGSHDGDWLDAVDVALDLLHFKITLNSRKVVLLTDFSGDFRDDKVDNIISRMKNRNLELIVIGPELSEDCLFDDSGEGTSNEKPIGGVTLNWNGKVKSDTQLAGESLIGVIVSALDGSICSFDEAIPQIIFCQKKPVKSVYWKTLLEIGTELQIPVTGRIKIKSATPNIWKRRHVPGERTFYHKLDDESTLVDAKNVIDGYRYGTSVVPFPKLVDEMSYSTGVESSQLAVLCFTRSENCSHQFRTGDQSMVIYAREGDQAAAVALSALIHPLKVVDSVAVVRKVYGRNCRPVLGALLPKIMADYECLVFVGLAFQEDYKPLLLPSLEKCMKNLTEEQNNAMDAFMDLMNLTVDGERGREELLETSSVVNPYLQNLYNSVIHRVVNPAKPPPPTQQHVLNILKTPEALEENLDEITEKLSKLFPTTEVVKRTNRKRENLDAPEDIENPIKRSRDEYAENVQFGTGVSRITSATPLEDYRALKMNHVENFLPICDNLSEVLLQLTETLSPQVRVIDCAIVNKILNCLEACRSDCLASYPSHYNKILTKLKKLVTDKGLLETTLWTDLKAKNLGLISKSENINISVSDEQAEEFFGNFISVVEKNVVLPNFQMYSQDYEYLLDQF